MSEELVLENWPLQFCVWRPHPAGVGLPADQCEGPGIDGTGHLPGGGLPAPPGILNII